MKKATSLLLCAVIILALVASCAKPVAPLTASELLNLGEKFLLELNYEQAVVQFLAVIEVEPMNARAYIGAAEAYIGLGDTQAAIAILQQGLAATDDAEIAALLSRLTEPQGSVSEEIVEREPQATAAPYTYEIGTEFTLQDLADWGFPWGMPGEELVELYGWQEYFQRDMDEGEYYDVDSNGGVGYHYDDKTLPQAYIGYKNCLICNVWLHADDDFEGVWFRGLELGMTPTQVMERFRHDRPIADIIAEAAREDADIYIGVYGYDYHNDDATEENNAYISTLGETKGVHEIWYNSSALYADSDGAYLYVRFENGVATQIYINYLYA